MKGFIVSIKLFSLLIAVLSLGVISCEKDEETNRYSAPEGVNPNGVATFEIDGVKMERDAVVHSYSCQIICTIYLDESSAFGIGVEANPVNFEEDFCIPEVGVEYHDSLDYEKFLFSAFILRGDPESSESYIDGSCTDISIQYTVTKYDESTQSLSLEVEEVDICDRSNTIARFKNIRVETDDWKEFLEY